jgi:hypothetical protein
LYKPRWRNAVKGVRYSYDTRLGGGNLLAWGLGSKGNYDKTITRPMFWSNAIREGFVYPTLDDGNSSATTSSATEVVQQSSDTTYIAQPETQELAAAAVLWKAEEAKRVAAAESAAVAEAAAVAQAAYLVSQKAIDDAARAVAIEAQRQAVAAVVAEQTRIAEAAREEEEKLGVIAETARLAAIEAAQIAKATAENGTAAAAELAATVAADMAAKATVAQAERDAAYEVAKTANAQIGTGITNAGNADIYIDPNLTPPLASSLPYTTKPLSKTSVIESGMSPIYIAGGIAIAGVLTLLFKK